MTHTFPTTIAARDLQALEQVWRQLKPSSCPHRYNFHMHSVFSDGQLTPEQIIDQAIAIGLEGFALTDHHSVKGYQAAQAYLEQQIAQGLKKIPHLWTGIEINGILLDTGVHILGYGFDPHHSALANYRKREIQSGRLAAAEVIVSAIHDAGGLAVLAHPARYRRPARELIPAAASIGMDGIEAYYAYDNPNPWHTSTKHTPQMQSLGQKHDLLLTCGTDTHGLNLLQRL